MCIERVHRLLMAAMLTLAAVLVVPGSALAPYLLAFIIAMLMLWAVTNFCPSEWAIRKSGIKPCGFPS